MNPHLYLVKAAMTRARLLAALGRLSPEAFGRLRAAGDLPSPMRYASGMERGNKALVEKLKALKITPTPQDWSPPPEAITRTELTTMLPTAAGYHPETGQPVLAMWKKPQELMDIITQLMHGTAAPRLVLSAADAKIMRALVTRHELDELRTGARFGHTKLPKALTEQAAQDQIAGARGALFGHLSPEVLRREGVHAKFLDNPEWLTAKRTLNTERPIGPDWPKSLLEAGKNKPLNEIEFMQELSRRDSRKPYGVYGFDKNSAWIDEALTSGSKLTRREALPLLASLLSQQNVLADVAIGDPTAIVPNPGFRLAAKAVSGMSPVPLPEATTAKLVQLLSPRLARRMTPQIQESLQRAAHRLGEALLKRSRAG